MKHGSCPQRDFNLLIDESQSIQENQRHISSHTIKCDLLFLITITLLVLGVIKRGVSRRSLNEKSKRKNNDKSLLLFYVSNI